MVHISPEIPQRAAPLLKREQWDSTVDLHIAAAEKTGRSDLSIIFLDINFFKRINDTIGYDAGDRVIEDVGNLIKNIPNQLRTRPDPSGREVDIVARDEHVDTESGKWGGDEFCILAHTDDEGTQKMVERIRGAFDTYLQNPAQQKLKELGVGIAIGTALYEPGKSRDDLIAEASEAMKQDKLDQLPELTPHEEKVREIIEEQLGKVDRPDVLLRHIVQR